MELKQQIKNILMVAVDINGAASNSFDKGNPAIMVDYSGHVASLSVTVFLNGWKEKIEPDYYRHLYMGIPSDVAQLPGVYEYLKLIEDSEKEITDYHRVTWLKGGCLINEQTK